eukprot:TRINITY_DN8497_c0_g1_i1.p1 TRINITY_DN8497_c0_g1~~TRINITY_DN8497_c0_g1_i1.p1  ORF type:complete len:2187 (-),score=404.17 TRINITY_DN8497_c0_g1_i1:17-6577(-)
MLRTSTATTSGKFPLPNSVAYTAEEDYGPKFEKLSDFVRHYNGTKVIEKVLVANNGIAAVKFIRSVRLWSYSVFGNERVIKVVVMATLEDIKANAEYIKLADQCELVPGGSNNNNYANVELINDIAKKTDCQAVWAGWGHASENPHLPDTLTQNDIIFIGPPGDAMRSLGDKISSSIVAQSAEVPTLPWNGSSISLSISSEHLPIKIPQEVYLSATIRTLEEGMEACHKIGYPCMIKASEGGGGKGIRRVYSEEEFPNLFRQVQGEVPGSPIFVMKMANRARHLEVQVIADNHGNAISIFGRDCSVQRRHQKIIEEAPVSVVDNRLFSEMEKAAVRLARLVGYVSAGTVEYLYTEEGFYFLELNPRLQVEHPCTEIVSDVNLPAVQLQIAMGLPLYCIADIRSLYGYSRWENTKIDFQNPRFPPKPRGHVIAARITAENPDEGFKPTSGMVEELNFRSMKNVWGYFSVSASGGLHEFADSQFGHIFAWGENREMARQNLVMALKQLSIRGTCRNTVEILIKLCETPEFCSNRIDTSWLDDLIAKNVHPDRPDIMVSLICTALHIGSSEIETVFSDYTKAIERGHILNFKDLFPGTIKIELIESGTKYTLNMSRSGPHSYILEMNGSYIPVDTHQLSDGGRLVLLGERSYVSYLKEEVDKYRCTIDGKTATFEKKNEPGVLRCTSPGKLVRYLVPDGGHVESGTAYAEVEVMKMYLSLISNDAGTIFFAKQPGSTLEIGEIIANIQLDDPTKIRVIKNSDQKLPDIQRYTGERAHQILKSVLNSLNNILAGYYIPPQIFPEKLNRYLTKAKEVLSDPRLPLLEFQETLSSLAGRIPSQVETQISKLLQHYEQSDIGSIMSIFPTQEIENTLLNFKAPEPERYRSTIVPFLDLTSKYKDGLRFYQRYVICSMLNQYYDVEKLVNTEKRNQELQIFSSLRDNYKGDIAKVFAVSLAIWNSNQRNTLVCELLDWLSSFGTLSASEKSLLENLSTLYASRNVHVALTSRKLLIQSSQPTFEERRLNMEVALQSTIEAKDMNVKFTELIKNQTTRFDVLVTFFYHWNYLVRKIALEVYVRRSYSGSLRIISHEKVEDSAMITFNPDSASKVICVLIAVNNLKNLETILDRILLTFSKSDSTSNCIQVAIKSLNESNDRERSNLLGKFVSTIQDKLVKSNVGSIVFLLLVEQSPPLYFSFTKVLNWQEDEIYRHVEPGLTHQLELHRLSNFNIRLCPTSNQQHVYFAEYKNAVPPMTASDRKFFVRAIVHNPDLLSEASSLDYWIYEAEKILVQCLSDLEIVYNDPIYGATDSNHIFINLLPMMTLDIHKVAQSMEKLLSKHGELFSKLNVTDGEIITNIRLPGDESLMKIRWFIQNSSGSVLFPGAVRAYKEYLNPSTKKVQLDPLMLDSKNTFPEEDISAPYVTGNALQKKRYTAQSLGTTYVYDFPKLFGKAVYRSWRSQGNQGKIPENLLTSTEFRLNNENEIVAVKEGEDNNIAMVAWKMEIKTPEYPEGRSIIVIANDITLQNGSFAPKEDYLFQKASEMARKEGIPRIYISVNSGARIGLAESIKRYFKISWKEGDPTKGFDYLFLTPEDYKKLNSQKVTVICEKVDVAKEERYKILDVIGSEEGIGVENLRGSGMIAGETSRAYEETFTISLVTCRTVGIGSYLTRLGQRVIQVDDSPIILTGAGALNKVLGRNVYLSNEQIGGKEIMFTNGITHVSVKSDLAGVQAIIQWLSYLPKVRNGPLPITVPTDPVDRDVEFVPTPLPYDPRWMIEGRLLPDNSFKSGFFDKGSWMETLAGWARNVICGRARLGGIPVGVIAVETRTLEQIVPVDPAEPTSVSQTSQMAGQVWFPNSSFKTAQAIKDFDKEQLPLIIFANWRGFSGGVRDMFNEILKYGSYIVDNLRTYSNPVIIYLPPYSELRGGAWVVVDPTINLDMMEMYADPTSRGGVLEPEGTVEIKYREKDLLVTMSRLDEEYSKLLAQLKRKDLTKEEKSQTEKQLKERKELLLPIYRQVAVQFADLHDTPGRMKAMNAISSEVEWVNSRRFFYSRLSRRIQETNLVKSILNADPTLNFAAATTFLMEIFKKDCPKENWENDKLVSNWMTTNRDGINAQTKQLKTEYFIRTIKQLSDDPTSTINVLTSFIKSLPEKQQTAIKTNLNTKPQTHTPTPTSPRTSNQQNNTKKKK